MLRDKRFAPEIAASHTPIRRYADTNSFSTRGRHLDTVACGGKTMSDRNTISILISQEASQPPKRVIGVPWYPGITVLQAMVIAQSMHPGSFSFRVLYHSLDRKSTR